MAAVGEGKEFGQENVKPGRIFRQHDLTRFDPCGLGLHAGQLVALGQDADRVGEACWAVRAKVLHKAETEAHVLDQHRPCAVKLLEGDHFALEVRIFEPVAPNVQKIIGFLEHGPGRADRVVARLARRRGHVPALYDTKIGRRLRRRVIAFEPFPLDQVALDWQRALLVLGRKRQAPDVFLDALERLAGFALRMQQVAFFAAMQIMRTRSDADYLVFYRDRRQVEMAPPGLAQEVPHQVILVQTVHDDDDDATPLVIRATDKGRPIPVDDVFARRSGVRFFGL